MPALKKIRRLLNRSFDRLETWRERDKFFFPNLGARHITTPKGRLLVSYTPWFIGTLKNDPEIVASGWNPEALPAIMTRKASECTWHTNFWESAELVRQAILRGWVVDYVSEKHPHLVPSITRYDAIIDGGISLPRWKVENPRARTLFYSTTGQWAFANRAALERHEWFFHRHGIGLQPERELDPVDMETAADLITTFGNDTVQAEFAPHRGRLRRILLSSVIDNAPAMERDIDYCRKNFIFFGGDGWIHRGLDLVIEAFQDLPELQLHIIGNYTGKMLPKLHRIYGKRLAGAENIHFPGPMNVASPDFAAAMKKGLTLIYPSASEGCSGCVVQAMHFGLVPLVTPVTGLAMNTGKGLPFLQGKTDNELISEIRRRCREISAMSAGELQQKSENCRNFARREHTRTAYSESVGKVLDEFFSLSTTAPEKESP